MTRLARRAASPGAALTVAVAAALLAVPGCGAGFNAQTERPYAPAEGQQGQVGDIRVVDAVVIAPAQGTGPLSLSATIANDGTTDDRLTDLTIGGVHSTQPSETRVPARGVLRIGTGTPQASASPSAQTLVTPGTGEALSTTATATGVATKPGDVVTLSVTLQRAGTVAFAVPVVPATGYWASAYPTPSGASGSAAPTASPTASGAPVPTATPGGAVTTSPSASASATP